MNSKLKGTLCSIGAAVSYGLNPLGALPLYSQGINTNTVLFFRYGLAVVLLALFMLFKRQSFAITKKETSILVALGILFAMSSLTLFLSFHYMGAGIACTLLFVYPVMVAVMMTVFFKEKLTIITILSIILALSGIALLYKGNDGDVLNITGVILVMISSLTYAIYIIVVNKSPLRISSVKLTFYVLLFGVIFLIIYSLAGAPNNYIQMLTTPEIWFYALILALFPTVISLLLMVVAVHEIGSTPTAIMGALEPLTAVVIGVVMFGEQLTLRMATGVLMILVAVLFIIAGKSLTVNKITTVIGRLGHVVVKHWRWRL